MRAQVSLTPAEAKKLIAKAVVKLGPVKQALAKGMIVMHPSSTTLFIAEEIAGERPKTRVWVCGVIVPKGACLERAASGLSIGQPEDFRESWVFDRGRFSTGATLRDLLARMRASDLYIKGANALDPDGAVGILVGNRVEGGTIGRVIAASKRKGFTLIFPVGLEKLVPTSIKKAAREALKTKYNYAMGIGCSLLPCKGIVVSETNAIEILSGAAAVPIAAGGLGGAEGSITLVIKGGKKQVSKALEFVEQSKGARLPDLKTPSCEDCGSSICDFPVRGKPWVKRG